MNGKNAPSVPGFPGFQNSQRRTILESRRFAGASGFAGLTFLRLLHGASEVLPRIRLCSFMSRSIGSQFLLVEGVPLVVGIASKKLCDSLSEVLIGDRIQPTFSERTKGLQVFSGNPECYEEIDGHLLFETDLLVRRKIWTCPLN